MKLIKASLLTFSVLAAGLAAPQARAGALFTNLAFFTYTNSPDYGWSFETPNGHTSALALGNDGNFYGTTFIGGTNYIPIGSGYYGYGTVFKMAPDGTFTSLYSFSGSDGRGPVGNLLMGADGNLYGATTDGGALSGVSNGSLFRITTNGILTTLYSFGLPGDLTNIFPGDVFHTGAHPLAGLVQGNDGSFYGTTSTGGDADGDYEQDQGTVFQFTAGGAMNVLHPFVSETNAAFGVDGGMPASELAAAPDGSFYGTTSWGGTNNTGTIFRVTTNGAFTPLYSFGATNGITYAPLLLGRDGGFYGAAQGVGNSSNGSGVIFHITTNGLFTVLHTFFLDGTPSGLIQASDGNFYGTTSQGGQYSPVYGGGTIYQMTPNGAVTTLYSFGGPDGQEPQGALVQGTNGDLYGTTSFGGPNWDSSNSADTGYGAIFRITVPPSFQSITQSNGTVSLSWSAMSNQTCQLQYTTNLASTNWMNVNSPVTVTTSPVFASGSISNSQCFYRILLVQ